MKAKRVAIYARVSTDDQHCEAQISELREYAERRGWMIYKAYRDHAVSGTSTNRPALNEMMTDCRRRRFDVLLVARLDRVGRSLVHLLSVLEELREYGVDFCSTHESMDTSTSSGKLLFHLVAAFAEYERSLIGERVRAGLALARKRGKRLGRPPLQLLSKDAIASLRRDRRQRHVPYRVLARKWGVSVWTAHRLCNVRG